ncbi:MAG: NAD(P)/FAD-dependent oxidoreductase [Anaerolineae bacterium]|nr:NAD(P)/FAD-dependent oxidoreductase [Anaerolineae bacterium]
MQTKTEYDVIIVGGRVSGSALAARLGKYGFRVVMLERANFPSLPAVSSPIIYASTMQMLDEIGADESAYAHNTPRLHAMHTVNRGFEGSLPLPDYKGRNYAYAIDRARFDAALWDNALRYPTVDGYQGFSVMDLLWDGDRVVGVLGKHRDGVEAEFRAKVVIGADGRFGLVAQKVGAKTVDTHDEYPTSIYYAYWQGVAPLAEDGEKTAAAYEGDGKTYGFLVMDSADDQTVVAVEGRAEVLNPEAGKVETFYLEMLQSNPRLWQRMKNAERVTTVRGMRNTSNRYHEAGGAGWMLVGDAYHQKDPLDGQGIYNAVATGKVLAKTLRRWRDGELSWEQAIEEYDEGARVKTYAMYRRLQSQVQMSFYAGETGLQIPGWMTQTMGRWLLQDPQFTELMGKTITRQIPPDMATLLTPPTMLGAMARGFLQDLNERFNPLAQK